MSDSEVDWSRPSSNEALDRLTALVDHNLVRCDADTNGEPRFAMLETLREFALEQLAEAGELDAVRQQHAEYYLGLAEAGAAGLWGPAQPTWLDRLESEQANLRAALAWGRVAAGWTDVGLRLGIALAGFWEMRGYSGEGHVWLADALERDATATPRLRAWALALAARLALQQGDVIGAATFVQDIATTPADADGWPVAAALGVLGQLAVVQGDYELAHQHLLDSLTYARTAVDYPQMARTLAQLAHLATQRDDAAAAAAYLDEELAMSGVRACVRGCQEPAHAAGQSRVSARRVWSGPGALHRGGGLARRFALEWAYPDVSQRPRRARAPRRRTTARRWHTTRRACSLPRAGRPPGHGRRGVEPRPRDAAAR